MFRSLEPRLVPGLSLLSTDRLPPHRTGPQASPIKVPSTERRKQTMVTHHWLLVGSSYELRSHHDIFALASRRLSTRTACGRPQEENPMPKHDPPGDDAALLELERELIELDRAIRAAEENREAIDYALFDRRDELMARIFTTPAAGLAGLAVQARAYLSEREVEFADSEGEGPLDFSHMGAVLAHGILTLADPVAGRAR